MRMERLVPVPDGTYLTDLDTWFAPYAMAELAILLALAVCGFWVSLAGQALFKNALLTDKPARVRSAGVLQKMV